MHKTFLLALLLFAAVARAEAPVAVGADWKTYRAAVVHPSLIVKPADIARARENVKRYAWAREYNASAMKRAAEHAALFTPQYVERMLEVTTPLSTIFTPCPACREQGKIWHPHGQWSWSEKDPERLKCELCGTVFPSEKYPESIVLHSTGAATGGAAQTFSFVGGEPFVVFGYKTGRPSMSGNIRSRKVGYVTTATAELTDAYLLSGDEKYAQTIRLILLRLAEVYPQWLVHSAYGEFADCDPRTAAANINALPMDELVYPPNKPDRVLHTGYWCAGRAGGSGQEGHFVRTVAMAYDATCKSPIYSDAERLKIEEKLLLESTYLLTADKGINNKSVGNRAAAAIVGLVCGEPSLVHFGVEGFRKTVDGWFLPDGGTPESASYAMMAFGNTRDLPLATRGYSDPSGYIDAIDKTRIDNLDLFHDSAYGKAWSAMVDSLQGDLTFAPCADTRVKSKIDSMWADLIAWQYPERPQYLALLKKLCGSDLHDANARFATWYREPGLENKPSPPLSLPDVCLPDLRMGHMRTGADGRESLLILNASHWGGHHHNDSLNLYYWKGGHEVLSDLGYLWDNPLKHQAGRTVAHNTVVIDEADQRSKEREGEVAFFVTSPHVKAMRASSKAYAQAKRYERTSAIIDHGNGRSYVADFFIVEGGKTQDFVFHGPSQSFTTTSAALKPAPAKLYDFANVRSADVARGGWWRMDWNLDAKTTFSAWSLPQGGEQAYVADGWGQRDPFNKDAGVTLPYIVRRRTGDSVMYFTSVFETHTRDEAFVLGIKRIHRGESLALEVETSDGTDYIESSGSGLRATAKTGKTLNWEFTNAK